MKKAFYFVVITAVTVLALVAARYSIVPARAEKLASALEVKIEDFSFAPQTLTVPLGTQVTWTNKDDTLHNIVDKNKAFKSKPLDSNEKFSYTFDKPGTYDYVCSIHPKMTGQIVVK